MLLFNTSVFGMEASSAQEGAEEQRYHSLFQKYKDELQRALAEKNRGEAIFYPRDACFDEMRVRYKKDLAAENFSWGNAEIHFTHRSLDKVNYVKYLTMSKWSWRYEFAVGYDEIKKSESEFLKIVSTNFARLFYPRGIVYKQKYMYELACLSVKLGSPFLTNSVVPQVVRNWINPWGFSVSLDTVVESYNSALCIQAYTTHLLNLYSQEGTILGPIERFSCYNTKLKLDPEIIRMHNLAFTTQKMSDGVVIPVYDKITRL